MLQVDESLPELERCSLFLNSAEQIQVQHVFRALPQLIARHGRLVFMKLGTQLRCALDGTDADGSMALADAFSEVLEQHLMQVRSI